jgi:hypothetical protein
LNYMVQFIVTPLPPRQRRCGDLSTVELSICGTALGGRKPASERVAVRSDLWYRQIVTTFSGNIL